MGSLWGEMSHSYTEWEYWKTDLSASPQSFSSLGTWGYDNQEGTETKYSSKTFIIYKLIVELLFRKRIHSQLWLHTLKFGFHFF